MNLFCDIETIPSDKMPELSEVKVPGNYSKPEAIQKYQEEHLLDEYKRQSLDSMKGRIFCVGWAIGSPEGEVAIGVATGTESDILERLETVIFKDARISGALTWVGWNLSTFDLPWLWRKSIKYGLDNLRKAIPHNNRNLTLDLMKVWASDFKDYNKMSDVAEFLGIPHSDVKGSDVYDLWEKGDTDAIVKHCREDIETCINIYKRIC
jgi:uncharacterized protein YprB with RNaseH-like and TPR domain